MEEVKQLKKLLIDVDFVEMLRILSCRLPPFLTPTIDFLFGVTYHILRAESSLTRQNDLVTWEIPSFGSQRIFLLSESFLIS